jgi:predicted nucleotidyltransferase
LLAEAVRLLRDAARPTRIILFGSRAREAADPQSDVDLMVVLPEVADRAAEIVRLQRVLSPLRIPVDLLVVNEEVFRYWCDTPGNIYSTAAREGRVLYEQAA